MGGWWLICSRKMALPPLCTACIKDAGRIVNVQTSCRTGLRAYIGHIMQIACMPDVSPDIVEMG